MSNKLSERSKKLKVKEMPEAAIEAYWDTLIEWILALTQRFDFFDGLGLRIHAEAL